MAKVVPDFPSNIDRANPGGYPWEQWLDGRVWELNRDTDFRRPTETVRLYAKAAAKMRGLNVRFMKRGSVVYVQAFQDAARTTQAAKEGSEPSQ